MFVTVVAHVSLVVWWSSYPQQYGTPTRGLNAQKNKNKHVTVLVGPIDININMQNMRGHKRHEQT